MSENMVAADVRQIVIEDVFSHSPETIWKTLTSGELMARWAGMAPAGFAPVVGNRFTYQTTAAGEWDGTIECEVLEVVPNERFAYSWRGGHEGNVGYGSRLDTIVTFTLEKTDGGTRLRLVHSGFVLPHNEGAFSRMSGGWVQVVTRIGTMAS
ncbi:SRPBCC family protein [Sphingopyxis kveilinensis]|uniref:SRPBCC family protein n=1 Tax=Sphingopyxis kveilinensis TaxID=3114367 RepID=UPI0030D108B3